MFAHVTWNGGRCFEDGTKSPIHCTSVFFLSSLSIRFFFSSSFSISPFSLIDFFLLKDINASDWNSGLYLMCRVVKRGKIKSSSKKTEAYRRTFAYGALKLFGTDKIGVEGIEKEVTIPIYTHQSQNENEMHTLPDCISFFRV